MYKHSTVVNNTLYVDGIDRLDLSRSCACGQSFRWHEDNGGFTAPALGRVVHARQAGDTLSIYPCAEGEAADWIHYFDLERDYAAIEERLSHDEQLKMCIPCATGIRVFNQDAFEALITFIISANNNIGRIAGIVERLCALCGERAELDGKEYFLVDIEISPDDRIVVEIDHADGVWIEDCVELSRFIEDHLSRDEEDYELEVGSAGLGQPFKVAQQYHCFVGKDVEVLDADGKKYKGVLKAVEGNDFTVTVQEKQKVEGKKRPQLVETDYTFQMDKVKYTKYLINFK